MAGFRLQHELVDHARTALDRLVRGEPVASLVEAARDELDKEAARAPLLVGVEGSDADRAALLEAACGRILALDRESPCAAIRIRRGDVMRFRAVDFDGRVETATMPEEEPSEITAVLPEDRRPDEVAALERALPRLVLVAPPVWAIWMWPLRWFLRWRYREQLAKLERARAALAEPRIVQAPAVAVESSRFGDTPERFLEALRELASGRNGGTDMRSILIEVPESPLPDDVELVELVDTHDADTLDLVLVIDGDAIYHGQPGGRGPHIGSVRQTVGELATLASTGRTIRIATKAAETLRAASSVLDNHLDAAKDRFEERIRKIEQLRITDTAMMVSRRLAAMRPVVIARVTMLVEHLMSEVGTALNQVEAIWIDEITNTTTTDELKATLVRIQDGSPKSVISIVDSTKRLATSGVLGAVHDLHPELVAILGTDHGLPEAERKKLAPLPSTGSVAPALFPRTAQWTFGELASGRLAGLFRSFDARRSEALAKVRQGAAGLRELALAELLDLEPALHTALGDALAIELARAVDVQAAWLAKELEREHAAIDLERVALAPLRQLLITTDAETRRIDERIAALRPSERGSVREIAERA
ncbi:MAG TPA: hypothetical protein VIU61_30025 [Kofleriaceae bacterium]